MTTALLDDCTSNLTCANRQATMLSSRRYRHYDQLRAAAMLHAKRKGVRAPGVPNLTPAEGGQKNTCALGLAEIVHAEFPHMKHCPFPLKAKRIRQLFINTQKARQEFQDMMRTWQEKELAGR